MHDRGLQTLQKWVGDKAAEIYQKMIRRNQRILKEGSGRPGGVSQICESSSPIAPGTINV
jgi:hypothetical protein